MIHYVIKYLNFLTKIFLAKENTKKRIYSKDERFTPNIGGKTLF
jgi:hypothetical protein